MFRAAACLAFLSLFLPPGPSLAQGLTEQERAGRRIYMEGRGEQRIGAFLQGPRITAGGTAFPCVKCHLEDGRGTLEGGVRSADITPFLLTKDYRGTRPSGRAHPPYTDDTLARAITDGRDPAGNILHEAHPRYKMAAGDLAALVAYLKVLGREPVPGVTDNEVRVGMLHPRSGPLAEAASDVKALLSGYFEEVNARGGIFGRALRLVPFPFDPETPGDDDARAKALVETGNVFCTVANLGVPVGDNAAKRLSSAEIPSLAPLLIAPESSYGIDRYTFHILPSLRDQGRVMVDFAVDNLFRPGMQAALLYAEDGPGRGGAAGAREQARERGLLLPVEESYPPGAFDAPAAVGRLERAGSGILFFFGGGREANALLAEADRRGFRPSFLGPAALIGDSLFSLPPGIAGKVYLSSPADGIDPGSKGAGEFFRIAKKYRLRQEHGAFQAMAFAGAMLLEEGLRLSGRSVTRSRFVAGLNGLWKFPTGVTPPLTYNENRRVGARGASILTMDQKNRRFLPAAGWREPVGRSQTGGGEVR
jgi:ABC-type branched-subunit amino acid transport system substrate-binding protein